MDKNKIEDDDNDDTQDSDEDFDFVEYFDDGSSEAEYTDEKGVVRTVRFYD